MRFKVTLQNDTPQTIPLNYQYPLSAWMYKVFNQAEPQFARWLHDHGYAFNGNRKFKLFTFSWLTTPKAQLQRDKKALKVAHGTQHFYISFHMEEAATRFIAGLFTDRELILAGPTAKGTFSIRQVEKLPKPDFPSHQAVFEALSPINVSKPEVRQGKLRAHYLHPTDPAYSHYLLDNLVKRYATAQNRLATAVQEGPQTEALADLPFDVSDLHWELLNKPIKRGQIIKEGRPEQTQVIGYQYRFRLTAPPELLQFAWDAGIGEKGSLGFGCVGLLPNQ